MACIYRPEIKFKEVTRMPYSKKNKKAQLSRKKIADINPREYTIMGTHPSYVHFNPAGEKQMIQPISHSLEKWILMILLAFAMAAFMGFKLLENSDLSFSMSDNSTKEFAAHSVSNDEEFQTHFDNNRKEARALMENHKTSYKKTPKYGKGATRYYAKKSNGKVKKIAKKLNKKKIAKKPIRKKTIAKRS